MADVKFPENFDTISLKTQAEIKRNCELFEAAHNPDYLMKHNGNHIWLEIAVEKQQFWSPLLHLQVENSRNNQTIVRGQFVQNPVLWAVFLSIRMLVAAVFTSCILSLYYNAFTGKAFGTELLLMSAAAAIWLALFLISKWNRKKAARQMEALHRLMQNITA